MYYDGVYSKIYIGRVKGWGSTQTEIIGNLTMPCDRFIYSGDNMRIRLYFTHNSTTVYQGYGAEWRNRDGTANTYIDNLGNFLTQGYLTARFYL
jgi:hypothetical protein